MKSTKFLFILLFLTWFLWSEDYFNKAVYYYSLKRFSIAKDLFNKCIKANPLNDEIYFYLGNIDVVKSNYLEARKAYQKAIDINTENPHYYYNYASLNKRQGLYDVAVAQYKKALSLDSNFYKCHQHLAMIHYTLYDWEKSIKHFETVLKILPNHPDRDNINDWMDKLRKNKDFSLKKRQDLLRKSQKAGSKPQTPFSIDFDQIGHEQELESKAAESIDEVPVEIDIID